MQINRRQKGLLGVACSLAPYFIIIQIITALADGTAELSRCLPLCAWMAGFWVLRYALHSVSTSLSHHATFHVLANTRTRLLDKLATLPLGTVLDRSSGSYKNIMIAHRLKTVRDADKIFVVDHGKLVQQGTHDELVAIPGKYKEFIDIRKKAEGWSLAE